MLLLHKEDRCDWNTISSSWWKQIRQRCEETILQLRSVSEQLKQLQFVPQDPKKHLFSTLPGWKIAGLILMRGTNSPWLLSPPKLCLCYLWLCVRKRNEPTTNTYTPPQSTANSGTKYMILEMHLAQCKENLYPIWICSCDRTIYDHYYTKKKKISSLCPSLCLTDSSIKY